MMEKKTRKKDRIFWIVIIVLFLIIGFLLGVILTTEVFQKSDYLMWNYACNDGCSIATKDNQGFLTNKTFECWDDCNEYIKDVKQELIQEKGRDD